MTSSGWCLRSRHNILKSYNEFVYYVYILQSLKKINWLYKGSTSDLKRRFKEHNDGKNFSTAPNRPFRLIYYEAYLLKEDAEAREKYLKTSMGKRVIKKQISNYLKTVITDKIASD
jgi:putative endonuclease